MAMEASRAKTEVKLEQAEPHCLTMAPSLPLPLQENHTAALDPAPCPAPMLTDSHTNHLQRLRPSPFVVRLPSARRSQFAGGPAPSEVSSGACKAGPRPWGRRCSTFAGGPAPPEASSNSVGTHRPVEEHHDREVLGVAPVCCARVASLHLGMSHLKCTDTDPALQEFTVVGHRSKGVLVVEPVCCAPVASLHLGMSHLMCANTGPASQEPYVVMSLPAPVATSPAAADTVSREPSAPGGGRGPPPHTHTK